MSHLSTIKYCINKLLVSVAWIDVAFCRHFWRPSRTLPGPLQINAIEDERQFRRGQLEVTRFRLQVPPGEPKDTALETLADEAISVSIPIKNAHVVSPSIEKDEEMTRERLCLEQ